MKRCVPVMVLGVLLAFVARAQEPKLTLLVTGDNRGEIAQCGCDHQPAGGLARRKIVVDQARARGPLLLLDTGNALFKNETADEASRHKARFILETMGRLGTAAMAVGRLELSAGPEFLQDAARKANMKPLSANLTWKGKRLFAPSMIITQGGWRIGVVGVGPAFSGLEGHPGLVGTPPIPAALAELEKLEGQVDLRLVLASLPMEEALRLSKEAGARVDFILQSGDSKRPTVARHDHANFVVSTGELGQRMASLELKLSGEGPLVDSAELARAEQSLALLEQQLSEARGRGVSQETQKGLEERQAQARAHLTQLRGRTGRSFSLSALVLGPSVAEDPELAARVEKLHAGGAPEH
ncbi:hypothetical protein D187_006978 [Cystobacter fuscus DSM 2262]|uniref:5'-nucleotidase n=1 Tax=Cystobacter fuscus (strain ATCC 25194 / DSM 2262 / NBRC 100088 / M29) TaxID=1242864 RepID=S9Q7C5_CYSF2|nr:hypothetical protein [Cystobacter fuscus]EPX57224.1 hypothetical protein D187_006978 [Cystobacter fuscus DSM 2262]